MSLQFGQNVLDCLKLYRLLVSMEVKRGKANGVQRPFMTDKTSLSSFQHGFTHRDEEGDKEEKEKERRKDYVK